MMIIDPRVTMLVEGVEPEKPTVVVEHDKRKVARDNLIRSTLAIVIESSPENSAPQHIGNAMTLALEEISARLSIEPAELVKEFKEWVEELSSAAVILSESLEESE